MQAVTLINNGRYWRLDVRKLPDVFLCNVLHLDCVVRVVVFTTGGK